ncbi:hypothetical protein GOHSU_14_01180 [Gordonia hirsuta DSM 44140 = NBRC 16056]|uniref:Low molecular weight antigen MTB12-like C-terminal domain-containing protein n=1 Tax=Gordonia hirsuta DSM 44140 = NBRC 16056 TaxID=1121927 RepID=L7L882_9ACTN|nr:hypothetical protein [Gordonia hirsuta]GAC56951.1 hypothetical protein GOHSU_14_01180 [Gordonia hirsuta DSM 44140 = NBRC 16056]
MINRMRLLLLAALASVATLAGLTLTAPAAQALPADFTLTEENPTAEGLSQVVEFLVATPASDAAKARNLEGGMDAVIVPKTVYNLGLFRAPRGSSSITEVTGRSGNSVHAKLQAASAGRPTVNMTIEFKKIDGNWRLANNSLCQGVKTVGLNIYCNV